MADIIIAVLLLYCFIEIVITFICLAIYIDWGNSVNWRPILFPSEWYKRYKLNWFGAIIASIGGFIFAPIVYLARIFSWLCHIGRK